jgi:hypothetical protein
VLVSKALGEEMKKVVHDAIKMVNFIKERPFHSRLFNKIVCKPGQRAHKSPATHRTPAA